LKDIAEFDSVAAVLAAAAGRDVRRILPVLILDAEERLRFLLPDSPDYPHERVR
jgi:hypothetical protein